MSQPGLEFRLGKNLCLVLEQAEWRCPHGRAGLSATRVHTSEEFSAVLYLPQEPVETLGIALAGIALEDVHELLSDDFSGPRASFDQQLGNRQRHLRVIGIGAGVLPVLGV